MSVADLLPPDDAPALLVMARSIQILGRTLEDAVMGRGAGNTSAQELLRLLAAQLRDAAVILGGDAGDALSAARVAGLLGRWLRDGSIPVEYEAMERELNLLWWPIALRRSPLFGWGSTCAKS